MSRLRNMIEQLTNFICCNKYSDLDDLIIRKAFELGLVLIGGTALEILANRHKVAGARKRSDNDLDFLSNDKNQIK